MLSLIGLDMIGARILPESFDELTVEDAREILERMPAHKRSTAWMMIERPTGGTPRYVCVQDPRRHRGVIAN